MSGVSVRRSGNQIIMNWTPFPPERPGKYLHTTKPDDIESLEFGDVYEQGDNFMFKDNLESFPPCDVLNLSGWWLEIVTPKKKNRKRNGSSVAIGNNNTVSGANGIAIRGDYVPGNIDI